jgi:hypothetical protein
MRVVVARLLAGHAQAHARHRLAPRLGNGRIAFFAVRQPRTVGRLAARALDRIFHGRVDLSCTAPSPAHPVAIFHLRLRADIAGRFPECGGTPARIKSRGNLEERVEAAHAAAST